MNTSDYRFTVNSTVAGIPCKLGVTDVGYYEPATYGKSWEDSEPEDYESHTYDILDRKGYRAAWLDKKCTQSDLAAHQKAIDNHLQEVTYDC